MQNENATIRDLVQSGVIGTSLGELIEGNKENVASVGAIAEVALLATLKANEKARESNLDLVYEENGQIIKEVNGEKIILKSITRTDIPIYKTFKIR